MMATAVDKYDSALLAVLQNEGKVAPFLDVILGFLYRRTDYFRIMKTDTDRLGFPPGVAEKLLINIFRKYETLSKADSARREEMKKINEKKTDNTPKISEEKVMESLSSGSFETTGGAHQDERGAEEPVPVSYPSPAAQASDKQDNQMEVEPSESTIDVEKSQPKPPGHGNEDEEEDPEQARERRQLQSNPNTYNGADREDYMWSQIITEADIRVKVPQHVVRGKQVKVDIQKKHVEVSYLDQNGSWFLIINSELVWEINKEESMWTLTPGEFVHINLEKREERWWEAVFVEEQKINTRKIDCSRPMTDLDDEAQAKIEEMMYNQRQKELGLPQSHEQKTQDMLRKAWDADGSPFKGQPFDPSRFQIDPSGIANIKPS